MKTFFSLPLKENKMIHECQTSTLKSLAFLLLWHEYTPTSVLAMFVPSFCHLSSCPDCAVSLLFAKVLALRVLLFFFSCRGAVSPLPLPVLVLMLRFACSSSFSCSSCTSSCSCCHIPQKQACYEWTTHLKTTHFSLSGYHVQVHSLSGIPRSIILLLLLLLLHS